MSFRRVSREQFERATADMQFQGSSAISARAGMVCFRDRDDDGRPIVLARHTYQPEAFELHR